MSEDLYKKIFSKNLRALMDLNNKTQIDLINDLGFNKSAVSTWCNGTRLPRMDKVDALAKYFAVNRSDLIEDKSTINDYKPTTIAAHLDTEDLTQDELDDVASYIEFIKSKRSK